MICYFPGWVGNDFISRRRQSGLERNWSAPRKQKIFAENFSSSFIGGYCNYLCAYDFHGPVHNGLMQASPPGGPLEGMGPENWGFLGPWNATSKTIAIWAPKIWNFQGPPLPIAQVIYLPASKPIQQGHINQRCIGSFIYMRITWLDSCLKFHILCMYACIVASFQGLFVLCVGVQGWRVGRQFLDCTGT